MPAKWSKNDVEVKLRTVFILLFHRLESLLRLDDVILAGGKEEKKIHAAEVGGGPHGNRQRWEG